MWGERGAGGGVQSTREGGEPKGGGWWACVPILAGGREENVVGPDKYKEWERTLRGDATVRA